jgi:hypothetical protein
MKPLFDEKDKRELCDDPDCHCEDHIDWDREAASQAAINLVEHTTRCFGYSSELTHAEKDATWTITVTCDPTRKHPKLKPKSIPPGARSFDERDLEYGRMNAEKMVENLRRVKVSEYEESLTDEYRTWTIVARWSGTLMNDPRWPLSKDYLEKV